ncbi:MAG: HlyD family type I secretion periplasmic adaptor subunit [Hydrogenophaga sp.]|uniref:HlyD family type I secretion periplasmic adaptor subunit n=1 Tax=Hydrogenophaga sp. TaxID=1904254 RepID=UPI0026242CDB|nr:HlyD family type I secretion periplasmic adaptor subunit [Hydrogenophaga sp.]MDM7942374.1 HlyD family type I secretion periplasmic adaptor subunit [Hydrogenophaga sp.]
MMSSRNNESTRGLRLSVWFSVLAIALFGTWAYHAEIDQITRGQGQIIASSRTQIIQAPDGGVIEDLRVREGVVVQRGEVLAVLESTKVEAAYRESESKVGALSATVSRLRAEVFGGAPAFNEESETFLDFRKNQLALLRKRRESYRQEIASMERMRALALKELSMTEPLQATGDVSMADVLKLQRQVADLEGQMSNRQNKYLQETQAELNKAEEELSTARELLIQRKEQVNNTVLKAPLNGTIKNVRVTTLGGVLRPGDELMQIVPEEDNLLVEAKVKPADVAFLKPGLPVSVKIDAYDYTIYGSLNGKLTYISADTMSDDLKRDEQASYRVQVKTDSLQFDRNPGQELPLQPGMTATIEVKTGRNTVWSYILKPIVKTLNESMGER